MTSVKQLVRPRSISVPNSRNKPVQNTRLSEGALPSNTPLDSLSEPKPLTTLHILQQLKEVKISDLDFDSDEEMPLSAPNFGQNERFYSDIVGLDVNPDSASTSQQKIARPAYKKDPTPNSVQLLSFKLLPEYCFNHVYSAELPEIHHKTDGHDLYKLRKKWNTGYDKEY